VKALASATFGVLVLLLALALSGCGPLPACPADGAIGSQSQLEATAQSSGNDGKVFCLHAGSYGTPSFAGARHNTAVTFTAFPGERVTFDGAVFRSTKGIHLYHVHFTGSADVQPGTQASPNQDIELDYAEFAGFDTGPAINVREWSDHVVVVSSSFHDLQHANGVFGSGYGFRASGPYGPITNVAVLESTFDRLGADAIELGGVDGAQIQNNLIQHVDIAPGSEEHADPLMLWAGSKNLRIVDNRFLDNSQPVYFDDGIDGRVEFTNNLIARTQNYCVQFGDIGAADSSPLTDVVFEHNTLWDCGLAPGFDGNAFAVRGNRSYGNTLRFNVLQSLVPGDPGIDMGKVFSSQSLNDIPSGYREAGDVAIVPQFRDRTSYVPDNLPFEAGYRP
jgi:Right handed beta helix region